LNISSLAEIEKSVSTMREMKLVHEV